MLRTEAFLRILTEYPRALEENFKAHSLAAFLRKDVPELTRRVAEVPQELEIEGSAGQGQAIDTVHDCEKEKKTRFAGARGL